MEQARNIKKKQKSDLLGGSSRVTTDASKFEKNNNAGFDRSKLNKVQHYFGDDSFTEKAPIEQLPNVSENMIQR